MKKRADGRYSKQILVGYKSDGRKDMKTIYGKTIREVELKYRKIMEKHDKGIPVSEKNITVKIWANQWLETYKKNVEANTFKSYKCAVENHIIPQFGYLKLSKLKLSDMQCYINNISDKYSVSTLKKIKITLDQMYKTAIQLQLVFINPVVGLSIPQKEKNEKSSISQENIKHIREFCKSYKHGAFIMTLLYTGMRRGEIAALTWGDIDFENNTISVNKAAEFIHNKPTIKAPKTKNSYRLIPILNVLKPYLVNKNNERNTEPVFKNVNKEMHTATSLKKLFENFNKEFNAYLKKLQGEEYSEVRFTMHQFRHTYATLLYYAGVDIKTAQSYLGHSSITVTMEVYTHLEEQFKNINADKLNNFVG